MKATLPTKTRSIASSGSASAARNHTPEIGRVGSDPADRSGTRQSSGSLATSATGFGRWHIITLAALFVGYAGYYVCRSNLAIVDPKELGLDKVELGRIFSIGVFLYAIGKVVNGIAADFIGGRTLFLFGIFASVAATVVFALGSGWWFFAGVWV